MAHRPDVLELLTDAHAETERLVTAYEATRDPERRSALAQELAADLERRALAEEKELDPVVRRTLPAGEAVAAAAVERRAATAAALARLAALDPDSPAADRAAGAVLEQVREAARDEEEQVHLPLRERLGSRERRRVGTALARRLARGGHRLV